MKRSLARLLTIALALALLLVESTAAAPGDLNPADLDPDFAAGAGRVTVSPTGSDHTYAIALAPDGKIVTAGNRYKNILNFEAARFLQDGSLDTAFNGTGVAFADFSEPGVQRHSLAYTALVQPDGKVVLGGHVFDQTEHDFGLARFTSTGALDPTFGADHAGLVRTHFGADPGPNEIHDNIVYGLGILPDGKIIASGHVYDGVHDVTGFARYCPDGMLDDGINCGAPGFGVGGKATLPYSGFNESTYPMALFPDGRFVIGGNTGPNIPGGDFVLYGLCANGELADGVHCNWSFGLNGRVTTDFSTSADTVTALAVQRDGKILAAGWTLLNNGITDYDYALVRYNTDGTLDSTFNGSGKIHLDVAGLEDWPVAVAVAPDNKIIVVGNDRFSNTTYSIVRFCANGALDDGSSCGPAQFGSLGIGRISGFNPVDGSQASGMAIQKDGRIVVAGMYNSPPGISSIGVARYMAGSHLSFSGVSAGTPFVLGNTGASIQLLEGGPCDYTIDKDNIFPRGVFVPGELPARWHLTNANGCTYAGILTLSYTDQELSAGAVTAEENLRAYFSNDGVTWTPAGSSTVNTAENSVSVSGVSSSGYWTLGVRYDYTVLIPAVMK